MSDLLVQPSLQLSLVVSHVEPPVSTIHLLLRFTEASVGVQEEPLLTELNLLVGTVEIAVAVRGIRDNIDIVSITGNVGKRIKGNGQSIRPLLKKGRRY